MRGLNTLLDINKPSFLWWMRSIPKFGRHWCVMVLISLSLELGQYLPMMLMQYVTDTVLAQQAYYQLRTVLLIMLLISVLLVGLSGWKQIIFLNMFRRFQRFFCAHIIHHMLNLPWDIQQKIKSAWPLLLNSAESVQKKLTIDAVDLGVDGLLIFLNLFLLASYQWHLLCIVVFAFVLTLAARYASYLWQQDEHQIAFEQRTAMTNHHLDTLAGLAPIKVHAVEDSRWHHWQELYNRWISAEIKYAFKQNIGQFCIQLIQNIELLLLISVGVVDIQHQRGSLGELLVFLSIRAICVTRINQFMCRCFEYRLARLDLQRVLQVTQAKIESVPIPRNQHLAEPILGSLSLENLSYHYPTNTNFVFTDLNIHIPVGEKLAIIGSSGCGKSTLIKLMMGLLSPTTGSIFVDKHDLKLLNLSSYKQQIACVLQDDYLFQASILQNLTWYSHNPDKDFIMELCTRLELYTWIKQLPHGLDTMLGTEGVIPSGGQKQRLLLARALYRQPKILFLDETSAHWDEKLEQRINDYVLDLPMTQIMIAHRPGTIARATRVWSLDMSVLT